MDWKYLESMGINLDEFFPPREGWEEAFKQYAEEGEDPLMFPDYIDSEAMNLLEGDTEF